MVVHDAIWDVWVIQSSLAKQQKNIEGHQVGPDIGWTIDSPKEFDWNRFLLKQMRVCNVMCILQKYTLPNLWLQTGRPLAEKQIAFHQQRWGWVAVQLFLFAFRWMLILDLIESSRVLVQQHDMIYCTIYTEKKSWAKRSKHK